MVVNEYVDLLIECKKDELVNEASNYEIIKVYKDYHENIKKYTKSAKNNKKSKLYKAAIDDLEKALDEVEKMEKDIKNMDATTFGTVTSILMKFSRLIFFNIALEGYRMFIIAGMLYPSVRITDIPNLLRAYVSTVAHGGILVDGISRVIPTLLNTGIILLKSIKILSDANEQIDNGESLTNSMNQYRTMILNSCKKSKEFINKEIDAIKEIMSAEK